MSETQFKQGVQQTFDTVANTYDRPALRFFPSSADYMVKLCDPQSGEQVLDIATGTGLIAMTAAQHIRPHGRVQAIDLSQGMLDTAQKNIQQHGVDNIDLHQMDAENLAFPDNQFDLLLCGFGVFFLPDPYNSVRKWSQVLKPGATIMLSTFNSTAFMPMAQWFKECYEQIGQAYPSGAWQQFSDEAACLDLLDDQFFENKTITRKQHGMYLKDESEWWEVIYNTSFRGALDALNPDQQTALRETHLAQLARLKNQDGIWLDIEVIYTQATVKK